MRGWEGERVRGWEGERVKGWEGGRVTPGSPRSRCAPRAALHPPEREFFIDNLLVRIHFFIVMIRTRRRPAFHPPRLLLFFFFFTLVTGPRRSLRLKLRDTNVFEPQMTAVTTPLLYYC